MLKIGDKIKYVKASPYIEFPIGTEFTVTDIQGITVALTGEYKCENMVAMIQGVMSYDEYEKYFEKCKPTTPWSEWKKFNFCERNNYICEECDCMLLCDVLSVNCSEVEYKYNNKKVLVKVQINPNSSLYPNAPKSKVLRAYASCCPEDKFDLDTGIKVALIKINNQIAEQMIKRNKKLLESI
jgi:hypothetical protein